MPGLFVAREHRKLVSEALALLEHPDIRPETKVGNLGVGAQQLVEVARALVSECPRHRLRRADQLAVRTRRRAVIRDRRAAPCPWAGRSFISVISSKNRAGSPRLIRCCEMVKRLPPGNWRKPSSSRSSPPWSGATSTSFSPACRTRPASQFSNLTGFRFARQEEP